MQKSHVNHISNFTSQSSSKLIRIEFSADSNEHKFNIKVTASSSISIFQEVEVKMQYSSVKHALESILVRVLPFSIHNLKRNILLLRINPPEKHVLKSYLIRRSSVEPDHAKLRILRRLQEIFRSFRLFDQIRIEDVEFVSLHHFWRWIIRIVMKLVILVPLITKLHTIEIMRLTRLVLCCPIIILKQY